MEVIVWLSKYFPCIKSANCKAIIVNRHEYQKSKERVHSNYNLLYIEICYIADENEYSDVWK